MATKAVAAKAKPPEPDEDDIFRETHEFYLIRTEDETGVSGTGIVAVGYVFPSGNVVLEWRHPIRSKQFYNSIADCREICGHGGKTQLVFRGEGKDE